MKRYENIVAPYQFKEFWSKYPHGYSIYEAVLDWLNQVNEMIETLNLTLKEFEEVKTWAKNELEQFAKEQMVEWLKDGTLEEIINQTLFESKLDKDSRDYVMFKEYGGSGLFHERLNKALLETSSKGLRLIVEGEHDLDGVVFLPSNTHLIINGVIKATTQYSSVFETFDRVTPTPAYTASKNIVVEGSGIIDANGHAIGMEDSDNTPFRIHHAENVVIRDISILNVNKSHAIEIGGSRNIVVDNVTFNGIIRPVVTTWKYAESIQIEHSSETGTRFAIPYDNTPTVNVTVKNCTFESSGNAKVWVGVGSHETTERSFKNISIINNRFIDVYRPCIVPAGWEDVTIIGNEVISCRYNFIGFINYKMKGIKNGIVSENIINNIGGERQPEIRDNYVIQVYVSENLTISNNTLSNSDSGFITVVSSQSINILNNTINYGLLNNPELNAIMLRHSSDVPLSKNVVVVGNVIRSLGSNISRHIHIPAGQSSGTHFIKDNIIRGKINNTDYAMMSNTNTVTLYDGTAYTGTFGVNSNILHYDEIEIQYDVGGNWLKTMTFRPHDEKTLRFALTEVITSNTGNYVRLQRVYVYFNPNGTEFVISSNNTVETSLDGTAKNLVADGVNNLTVTMSIKKIVGKQLNKSGDY